MVVGDPTWLAMQNQQLQANMGSRTGTFSATTRPTQAIRGAPGPPTTTPSNPATLMTTQPRSFVSAQPGGQVFGNPSAANQWTPSSVNVVTDHRQVPTLWQSGGNVLPPNMATRPGAGMPAPNQPGTNWTGLWWTNQRTVPPDEADFRTFAPYKFFDPILVNTSDLFSFDFRYNMLRQDKITRVGLNIVTLEGWDPHPNFLLIKDLPPRRILNTDPCDENTDLEFRRFVEETEGGISGEIPEDGHWVDRHNARNVIVSASPPASPRRNQLWWDAIGGQMYIWFADTSGHAQWVAASNLPGRLIEPQSPEPTPPRPGPPPEPPPKPPLFPPPIVQNTVVSFRLFPRTADVVYEIQCVVGVMPCGQKTEYEREIIALAGLRVLKTKPWLYGATR